MEPIFCLSCGINDVDGLSGSRLCRWCLDPMPPDEHGDCPNCGGDLEELGDHWIGCVKCDYVYRMTVH